MWRSTGEEKENTSQWFTRKSISKCISPSRSVSAMGLTAVEHNTLIPYCKTFTYFSSLTTTATMKISTTLSALAVATSCSSNAVAFAPSSSNHSVKSTALNAKKQNVVAGAAFSALLGLGLSVQVASANIDEFSLPSYDSSKGTSLIDLNDEVATVNKNKRAEAKAKREYVDTSAEKIEMDRLRKAEKDGSSLLDSLASNADAEKKARIEAEKAESRANRWKTF